MSQKMMQAFTNPTSVTGRAFMNPGAIMQPGAVNTRAWRGAEIPAANGTTNARSLAKVYGVIGNGGESDGYRLLSAEGIERCHTVQSETKDEVLFLPIRFGLGYMVGMPLAPADLPLGPRVFGHGGAGGSLGVTDPDAKMGFGYVMNKMSMGVMGDPRALSLLKAVYKCL